MILPPLVILSYFMEIENNKMSILIGIFRNMSNNILSRITGWLQGTGVGKRIQVTGYR